MIGPDLELSDVERGHLLSIRQMPGFQIILNVMESMVVQCQTDMINADPSKSEEVLAKHTLARAAAEFYARVVRKLNTEMEEMLARRVPDGQILPDPTEPLFQ